MTAATQLQITLNGVTAGSLLVLCVSYIDTAQGSSATPAAATDSNGTVAAAQAPACMHTAAGVDGGACIYYVKNAAAGTHTFTFNPFAHGGALYANATLDEWSGIDTIAPLDKNPTATTNSAAASTTGDNTGTTATLSQANELVYAVLSLMCTTGLASAGISTPASSGYTSRTVDQATNTSVGTEISYKEVAATTAVSGAWTWTADASMVGYQAVIATFLETAVVIPRLARAHPRYLIRH